MTALQRKLWRDLRTLRGQTLAIALVVMAGVAALVMAVSNYEALSDTRARFYDRYRFAEVFAHLTRAPLPLLDEIRALPGVRRAEGRIVMGVNLDLDGQREAMTAQVVSLPDSADGLNQLFVREGTLPSGPGEAVIGEVFAETHHLHPGDTIHAVFNGRRQAVRISGVGLSPEYVYTIRPGDLFPDFERFTVLWMPRQALANAFDLDGAFNQLVLGLDRGVAPARVIDGVDRLLQPYGGTGAFDRDLQLSNRMLSTELEQLQANTRLFSAIFLGVTAFLLSVVLGRLIGTQREQVAVLKAFGYSRWDIGTHYAQLVLCMVGAGLPGGLLLGAWLGRALARLYMRFYRFPSLEWSLSPEVWALSVGFVLCSAALGTLSGLRRAFLLSPAEGMRPEAPPVFRRTWSERLGLGHWLDTAARMVLRNLERRPWRSVLSVVGIGLACGILVMSRLQSSAIDEMVSVQFGLAQRDDLSVTLINPGNGAVIDSLHAVPGVLAVEAFREAPVRLRHGWRTYTTALLGMEAQGDLKRVLNDQLQPVTLPPSGVMLTDYLAGMLDLQPGDAIEIEFLDGARQTVTLPVTAKVREYLGVGIYARRDVLNRVLHEGDVVSGAWLRTAPGAKPQVLRTLRGSPRIAGVTDRAAAVASFYATMAENMLVFAFVMTCMAASIAIGVVYNAARITLAERARDLASLRILGFTRAEVRDLLLGELATLSLLALLPGFASGYGMSWLLVHSLQSDLYRVPLILTPPAFALAGGIMLAAAAVSAWLVVRRLRRMDLVAVLKTRE